MTICANQDLLDTDQQLAGQHPETSEEHIKAEMLKLHTCCPGVIVSFDPDTQTVEALPVTQCVWSTLPGQPEGTKGVLTMPKCVDVPVKFPGGGGWFLTFPVAAGDECILCFSERCIDGWFQNGPIPMPPARYRTHDLADAFALVGINSQPNVLQDFYMDGPELRARDDSTYLRMKAGQIEIQGNVIVHGSITADDDTDADNISLDHHVHGDSGPPTGNEEMS